MAKVYITRRRWYLESGLNTRFTNNSIHVVGARPPLALAQPFGSKDSGAGLVQHGVAIVDVPALLLHCALPLLLFVRHAVQQGALASCRCSSCSFHGRDAWNRHILLKANEENTDEQNVTLTNQARKPDIPLTLSLYCAFCEPAINCDSHFN